MELDKETQEKIQELQSYEQNINNLIFQKQTFQMELNESENALEEIKKTNDSVFKIIGQIMIKSDKDKILKELENKKKILSLRLESIEKQEKLLSEKSEKLRQEVMKKIK